MTTKHSPLPRLKAQADQIAKTLKQAERGEGISAKNRGGAFSPDMRGRPTITFGLAMDDKIIKITVPWSLIAETEEAALAEYILAQMRESDDRVQ